MASGKSVGQSNATLDMWLGGVMPTIEETLWLMLFTTAPNKNGGGVEVSTVSTAYARIEVTNDGTTWSVAVNGRKVSLIDFLFAQATADWGQIVAAALVNTASGAYTQGYWGLLTRKVTIRNGDRRRFPAGAVVVTES